MVGTVQHLNWVTGGSSFSFPPPFMSACSIRQTGKAVDFNSALFEFAVL